MGASQNAILASVTYRIDLDQLVAGVGDVEVSEV